MQPVEAQRFVEQEMTKTFRVANLRDRTKDAQVRPALAPPPALADIPRILGVANGAGAATSDAHPPARPARTLDVRIRVAGFGGQGVLMLGEVLAEAGLDAGYEVSWLPSYGPEMRSGTSNCHVRLSSNPIDSPLVSRPDVLLALNEPSLRKFLPGVVPGGLVLYNSEHLPEDCARPDVRMVTIPFTELADQLGNAKAANIVMLGALLETADLLDQERVTGALRRKVKSQKWFELDVAALAKGREEVRKVCPVD
jgi:Pyruvate/2-oxoacid:ferredoxin oxidoreductase gamma subunit